MGYQESYLFVKEEEKFNDLLELVKKHYYKWDVLGVKAIGIMTLNEAISDIYPKGMKFIHICGERHGQRTLDRLFDYNPPKGAYLIYCEVIHHFHENRELQCTYEKIQTEDVSRELSELGFHDSLRHLLSLDIKDEWKVRTMRLASGYSDRMNTEFDDTLIKVVDIIRMYATSWSELWEMLESDKCLLSADEIIEKQYENHLNG